MQLHFCFRLSPHMVPKHFRVRFGFACNSSFESPFCFTRDLFRALMYCACAISRSSRFLDAIHKRCFLFFILNGFSRVFTWRETSLVSHDSLPEIDFFGMNRFLSSVSLDLSRHHNSSTLFSLPDSINSLFQFVLRSSFLMTSYSPLV